MDVGTLCVALQIIIIILYFLAAQVALEHRLRQSKHHEGEKNNSLQSYKGPEVAFFLKMCFTKSGKKHLIWKGNL